MPHYSVQTTIFPKTNIVEDASTNSWSCEADDVVAVENFLDNLVIFYHAIDIKLSNLVRQNGHLFKVYDRADPEPRAPVITREWDLDLDPAVAPLPTEAAICVSFEGTATSGVPQARRRGRVYIGPLGVSCLGADGYVGATTQGDFAEAAAVLGNSSAQDPTYSWEVWSTVNQAGSYVTGGWVDNEFDTQRRRGRKATNRLIWP